MGVNEIILPNIVVNEWEHDDVITVIIDGDTFTGTVESFQDSGGKEMISIILDTGNTERVLERSKFVETRPIRHEIFPKWTEVK